MFKYLLKRLFGRSLAYDAQGLAVYLIDEYAAVLSKTEMDIFFKLENRNPMLLVE